MQMKTLGIGCGTFQRRKKSSSFFEQPSKMRSLLNQCSLNEGYSKISSTVGVTQMKRQRYTV
ncbi:hypothetical protein TSUD_150740 [Trifolium subterraneum]|uniref:Uncharacterized protein n=1 Tax=Trifolium subterraneum TaxID=3900 RepID=A0A2Z6MNP3_TRISU|nr:hypothetical protein TSUD_150740 [Trifolium subterraneum]